MVRRIILPYNIVKPFDRTTLQKPDIEKNDPYYGIDLKKWLQELIDEGELVFSSSISNETFQDLLNTNIIAGTNITIVYDDTLNTYTINASGGSSTTDLAIVNRGVSTLDITSSSGADVTVPAATTSLTGLMTSADKTELTSLRTIVGTTGNNLGTFTGISIPDNTTIKPALQSLETSMEGYAAAYVGSTTNAPGVAGRVFDPPQDSQNKFFTGGGFMSTGIPSWTTTTVYEVGDIIYDPATNKIYRTSTQHTAGGSINLSNFTELSPSSGSSATDITLTYATDQIIINSSTGADVVMLDANHTGGNTDAGLVSSTAQIWNGTKQFTNNVNVNAGAGAPNSFTAHLNMMDTGINKGSIGLINGATTPYVVTQINGNPTLKVGDNKVGIGLLPTTYPTRTLDITGVIPIRTSDMTTATTDFSTNAYKNVVVDTNGDFYVKTPIIQYNKLSTDVTITGATTPPVQNFSLTALSTNITAGVYEVEISVFIHKVNGLAADVWALGFDTLPNGASGYGSTFVISNAGAPKYADIFNTSAGLPVPATGFIVPGFPPNQSSSGYGNLKLILTVPTTTTITPNIRFQTATTTGMTLSVQQEASFVKVTKIS
jgi:hypothetical protein